MERSFEIPDARDGLTPLERGALFAIGSGSKSRRASTLFDVGPEPEWDERLGLEGLELTRAHPEYDAAVALAQDWVVAHPLVEGIGNVGSIDDDPRADAWYVDLRVTPVGRNLLEGSDTNDLLTSAFPTLLVNGSRRGLARFLPHNLREVTAAIAARLADPALDLDGVMAYLPGPDFPTGGRLIAGPELHEAYRTGRGEIRVRGRAAPADRRDGRGDLVVVEMPYLVAKGGTNGLIVELVELAARREIPITNIVDESDRHGIALRLTPRSGVDVAGLERRLLATSRLAQPLEIRMLAAVDGVPTTLPLLDAIDVHIDRRREHHRALGIPESRIDEAIVVELTDLGVRFGRDRRTEIVPA